MKYLINRIILLTGLFLLLSSINTFSFEFSEHKWGASKNRIAADLIGKEYKIQETDDSIKYIQWLFKRKFLVTLFFDPDTNGLYKVNVAWNEGIRLPILGKKKYDLDQFDPFSNVDDVGEELEEILVGKYGKPLINKFSTTRYWKGNRRYDILSLKYGSFGEPILTYYGGNYYKKYMKK